jgi:hypothetical protein
MEKFKEKLKEAFTNFIKVKPGMTLYESKSTVKDGIRTEAPSLAKVVVRLFLNVSIIAIIAVSIYS